MWASLLGLLPLVLRSLGAPLGEPVADDFDHLHYALFAPHRGPLDGGGSLSFWRPVAYQGYFGLMAGAILGARSVVVVLHVALLGLATVLAYRTLRRFLPAPWATAAASFPLLCESARALIAVPVHIVDVGLIAFSALAAHEAAAGRLAFSLVALALALGCKESAVATALVLPALAPPGRRAPWIAGVAALTLVWGLTYLWVRSSNGLMLPRGLESELASLPAASLERARWAVVGTARALFSLPLAPSGRDLPAALALAALAIAAVLRVARDAEARERLLHVAPVALAGALACTVATAPLVTVHPIWSPQRVVFGALGAGTALAALLGAVHPALLAGLVAIRLALFALAPAAPAHITYRPPETGAFVDFERLARVQRLAHASRAALMARHPVLPHGARVAFVNPPLLVAHAFGGSRALQCWYRDTTLRWLRYEDVREHPDTELSAVITYEHAAGEVMLIEPGSFRHYLAAGLLVRRERWEEALEELMRADSALVERRADAYRGRILGRRAFCWLGLGRTVEAERDARVSLALMPNGNDARYTFAAVLAFAGRRDEAEAQLDTLLANYPNDRAGRALRDSLDAWAPREAPDAGRAPGRRRS
jgi:hypothetical protein